MLMPAAVGSTSLASVVGACVALPEMLDVVGTEEDGGQAAGTYRLQKPRVQQFASQRLKEIPGPP